MPKKTYEEIITEVTALFGETPTDEQFAVLEDIKDSFGAGNAGEDWEKKYNDLDKSWRERYKAAFLGEVKPEEPEEEEKTYSYDELFEEDKE